MVGHAIGPCCHFSTGTFVPIRVFTITQLTTPPPPPPPTRTIEPTTCTIAPLKQSWTLALGPWGFGNNVATTLFLPVPLQNRLPFVPPPPLIPMIFLVLYKK
jgi:hypothetical protein